MNDEEILKLVNKTEVRNCQHLPILNRNAAIKKAITLKGKAVAEEIFKEIEKFSPVIWNYDGWKGLKRKFGVN